MTTPTIYVSDVVDRAAFLLNDVGNNTIGVAAHTRWTEDEMIDWVADAQRQIIINKPSASALVKRFPLVAGTRQALPANGWLLLSVNRNLDGSNNPGRAVRQVDRRVLDAQNPNWHMDPAQAVVWNYTYDENDQYNFYIYPPNDGTGGVEANYSQSPDKLTALTDALVIDPIYLTPMVDYVCFRALSKDAEFAGGASLSANFFAAFNAAINTRETSEKNDSPDATFSPPGPGNYRPPGAQ